MNALQVVRVYVAEIILKQEFHDPNLLFLRKKLLKIEGVCMKGEILLE